VEIALESAKNPLEDRFDAVGWGLLSIVVGVMAMPSNTTTYVLAAAAGAAMLSLNVVRLVAGVPVRWLSVVLGSVVLVAGIAAMAGMKIDAFAAFFVLLGVVVVAGAIVRRDREPLNTELDGRRDPATLRG
jgi:hypothetical protein